MAKPIPLNTQGLIARIAARRRKLGITQRQLAQLADVSESFISHLECGLRNPSAQVLLNLCNALQMSPNALVIDSLPENLYGEALPPSHPCRRRPKGSLCNTLSNWVLADTLDESLLDEDDTDICALPPIGFLSLADDMPQPFDLADTDENNAPV